MLVDENPQWGLKGPKLLQGSPVAIHLYVEDADAFVARAAAAGAKVTVPVSEAFWGDRYGAVEDPYGHRWSVATHVRDLSPEEIKEGMAARRPYGRWLEANLLRLDDVAPSAVEEKVAP